MAFLDATCNVQQAVLRKTGPYGPYVELEPPLPAAEPVAELGGKAAEGGAAAEVKPKKGGRKATKPKKVPAVRWVGMRTCFSVISSCMLQWSRDEQMEGQKESDNVS